MIHFCVKRPVATSMIYAAILLLGFIGASRLRVNLFPDITFPRITVLTPYSNVQAEEIENLVTRPLEDALSAVPGVSRIRSLSQEGLSIIHIDLEWGSSTDSAIIQARQKVDLARSILPQDTGKSMIVRFDPSREPVLSIIAHPTEQLPFVDVREFVERNVRPLFERIDGVASISIQGGYRREIHVDIDRDKLRSYNLSLGEISRNLDATNYTFPAGSVKKGKHEFQVKVKGEFETVEEIAEAVVGVGENGAPISLSRLGTVRDAFRDRTATAIHNGEPAVLLFIRKEPSSNTVETAQQVREELEEINTRFKDHIHFEILHDGSQHIVDSIGSVILSAILGAVIAFSVLLIFLHDIKVSIIIVLSIPISILSSLLLMYVAGISLNVISLGGLALGTGMLVDSSIVVIESIHQARERGFKSSIDASGTAITGTVAVAGSVTASTMTSIIVFLPILFVPGIAGAIFRDLSLTVTFSLLSSLLISLTLIPMLSALPTTRIDPYTNWIDHQLQPVYHKASWMMNLLQHKYSESLKHYLLHPRKLLYAVAGLSLGGLILLFSIDRELFPETDSGIIHTEVILPEGTNIDDAEQFLVSLHNQWMSGTDGEISSADNTGIRNIITSIGMEEDDIESRVHGKRRPHYSRTTIYLEPQTDTEAYLGRLKAFLEEIPSIRTESSIQGDILQSLLGNDRKIHFDTESAYRNKARTFSEQARQRLEGDERIRSMKSSSRPSIPEIRITLDRMRLASLGLTVREAALALRSAVFGEISTVYREEDREIDVRLRFRERDREKPSDLKSIPASPGGNGRMIELSSLIESKQATGYETILREDQRRLERIEIEAAPGEQKALNEDLLNLKTELESQDSGIQIRVQKTNQETMDSLKDLLLAFILSSVLIYQLLAGQFESFIHPFTLILSIPMMFAGTGLALLITGNTLNIQSTIGLVMLTGIVVNNAIVLYESITEKLRGRNQADRISALPEVLDQTVRSRLRPILLSSLTTILALLPMAMKIGPGAELQSPLAVVVIGGLLVSTVLTLLCFPVLFYLVEQKVAVHRERWRAQG